MTHRRPRRQTTSESMEGGPPLPTGAPPDSNHWATGPGLGAGLVPPGALGRVEMPLNSAASIFFPGMQSHLAAPRQERNASDSPSANWEREEDHGQEVHFPARPPGIFNHPMSSLHF